MKLKITIAMDNAAFADADESARWRNGYEPARILTRLANEIKDQTIEAGNSWTLRDINGNRVGEAKVTK